jgi:hypothetical protein
MSLPPASTSIKVLFYDGAGTPNTDFSGQLSDNRTDLSITLNGDSTKVLTAKLYIDSDAATGTATQKQFPCQMGCATTVGLTGSTGHNSYPFAENGLYALKLILVMNETGYKSLFGKFSVAGATETPSYTYRHETAINTFASATVTNPNDIQYNGSIELSVPFDATTNPADTRKPASMVFSFDVIEGGADTDNREALNSYSVVQDYAPSGAYTLTPVKLANHNKYLCSITGVFSDGFTVNKTVAVSLRVAKAPVIESIVPYGLGVDGLGAGTDSISSVMDITMQTEETGNFTGDPHIIFKFTQTGALDEPTFYEYKVQVKSGVNPVYYIQKADLQWSGNLDRLVQSNVNGKIFYQFNVTAYRTYDDTLIKKSAPYSANFTQDVTPLSSVSLYNQWSKVAATNYINEVTIDSVVTQAKWNSMAETGFVAKFSKTPFFGNGIVGLYSDLDKTSTKFKIEASSNGGQNFSAVTSLRMGQGSNASSDEEDRNMWASLLDSPLLSNPDGLYDNIPWPSQVLGQNQSPLYILGECPQNASLVLKVSIVAPVATLPNGTSSNVVQITNKVNTPVVQPAFYSISNNTLVASVDDEFATSNDILTGVRFTSNMASPNDFVFAQKPGGNTTNKYDFHVANIDSTKRGPSAPVVYQISHVVDTKTFIATGLKGPETSVVCYNPPTKHNFNLSNVVRNTVNNDAVSSLSFNVAFNNNNNATIKGIRAYFNAANNVSRVFVRDVLLSEQAALVTITLSDKSFYSNWANLSAGTLDFVPLYDDFELNGTPIVREVPSEQKAYEIYKVQPISSTPASLVGGLIQKGTTLNWSGDSGSSYSLVDGVTDLSSGIVAAGSNYSYTFSANSLSQGQSMNLNLKKKHTLDAIPQNLTGFVVSDAAAGTYTNFTGSEPLSSARSNRGIFVAPEKVTVTSLFMNAGAVRSYSYTLTVFKTDSNGSNAIYIGSTTTVYESETTGAIDREVFIPYNSVVLTAGEQLVVDYILFSAGSGDYEVRQLPGGALPMTVNYMKHIPTPVTYGAPAVLEFGPTTVVTFTAASVDTSTMAITVKRDTNATQLKASHAQVALSHPELTNVTIEQLCNGVIPLTFSSGPGSTADKQAGSVDNLYSFTASQLGWLQDLKMTLEAGVAYSVKVGSAATVLQNSSSVRLDQGPYKALRVAGKPSVSNRSACYTVESNRISFQLSIDANGLMVEGLSSVTAIIVQNSDFTDASDPNAGNGATMIATFTPAASIKSYDVASPALGNDATDNLAAGETRSVDPEDLSTGVHAIESGAVTLAIGNLGSNDTTWLSLPAAGFDATKNINVLVIAATQRGSSCLSFTASHLP